MRICYTISIHIYIYICGINGGRRKVVGDRRLRHAGTCAQVCRGYLNIFSSDIEEVSI